MKKAKSRKALKKGIKRKENYVIATNSSYGKTLKGTKIYYEGKRPTNLAKDGKISLGKHVLTALKKKYHRFRWVITTDTNSITIERGITRVRTSLPLLKRMNDEAFERSADIKHEIVATFFGIEFPQEFKTVLTNVYVPGTLSKMLDGSIIPRLTSQDKEAIIKFLPDFVASEASASVSALKATAEIESLKALADRFEYEIGRSHPESWWQGFIKDNILLMQQGYIKALDKLNVAIGDTKFPDFCLVTHDNYIDILEIKKPDTPLVKLDVGRNNYYWDTEVAKAMIQTENYIEAVNNKAAELRSYLLDRESINVKAVRPRGIILVGETKSFTVQKQKDDFRLLTQSTKNIVIVTYDELLTRMKNYINVLETYSKKQ